MNLKVTMLAVAALAELRQLEALALALAINGDKSLDFPNNPGSDAAAGFLPLAASKPVSQSFPRM